MKSNFDRLAQFFIPFFTIAAFASLSLKHPFLSLVLNLAAQPFWIYSAWKSYKGAGQTGILVNTFIITLIILAGIINYLIN